MRQPSDQSAVLVTRASDPVDAAVTGIPLMCRSALYFNCGNSGLPKVNSLFHIPKSSRFAFL